MEKEAKTDYNQVYININTVYKKSAFVHRGVPLTLGCKYHIKFRVFCGNEFDNELEINNYDNAIRLVDQD